MVPELHSLYMCASRLLLNPGHIDVDELEYCKQVVPLTSSPGVIGGVAKELAEAYKMIVDAIRTKPLDIEEEYINLFELAPKCPLNITHYMAKDERDRTNYMLRIAGVYQRAGLRLVGELPDHLPAILEFLALTSDTRLRSELSRIVLPGLRDLLECLQDFKPYSLVVQAALTLLEHEVG